MTRHLRNVSCLAIVSVFTLLFAGTTNAFARKWHSYVSIAISPTSASLISGGTQQFTATVSGTTNTGVTWTASAGTISSTGVYTAPSVSSGTTATVTATSQADSTKSASASVSISAPSSSTASGAVVSLSPASLNFGSVNVGSTSSVQYVTVTNTGNATLNFSNTFSFTGDFASANVGTCGMSVAPGSSCTASVSFTPTASGTRTGTLTMTDNAANSPQTVALSGTGGSTTTVAVSISPASASLTSGGSQQFSATVSGSTNTGVTWKASAGTISSTGLYTAPTVSSSTTATVTATSAADSTKSASASVSIAAASAPVSVAISPNTASLSSGGTQQFSATVSGSTNTGVTWKASAGTISSTGLYTAPTVSSSTTATVTATSAADSTKSASATLAISAPVSSGPVVSLSPASLNFGSVNVGSTSSVQYVTVTNTGNATLNFSNTFSFTGDFASANVGTCGMSVAPGSSCTASVSFTPTASGTRTGTLTMTDNAANSPQTVALSGTGGSSTTVAVSISPTTATLQVSKTQQFSATVSGSTNTAVTWQVNGTTGGSSTVGTISTAGLYTAPATVPSGGSVTVTAVSAADTTKSASASVSIAAAASTVSVTISPTSVALSGGKTQQFTGTVSGTTNTGITWQVNGVTGGSSSTGTIGTSGLYTAPTVSSNTTVTITARSSYDSTAYANATASIAASASASTSSGPALYVATTGSDSNSCTSTAPCATIAHASSLATPGTTIHVAPGTYTGNIVTSTSGTASARITYISDTPWGAKLVGTGSSILWELDASYVDVNGFDISGPNNYAIYAGWSGSTPGYDHFLNNHIHDITNSAGCTSTGGAAIDTGSGGSGNDWFIGNVVTNIGASMIGSCNTIQGIYISNANTLVQSNLVSGVAGYGIQQWHAATASIIVNNTVFNCRGGILLGDGDGGALPGGSSNNFVANNISVHNTAYGLVEGGTMGSNNVYTDNLLWSNPQSYVGSSGQVSGTISSDPLFVNYQANGSGNYHLSAGSPAINAGTPTDAPTTDVSGQAQTDPPSIGAYAYPL